MQRRTKKKVDEKTRDSASGSALPHSWRRLTPLSRCSRRRGAPVGAGRWVAGGVGGGLWQAALDEGEAAQEQKVAEVRALLGQLAEMQRSLRADGFGCVAPGARAKSLAVGRARGGRHRRGTPARGGHGTKPSHETASGSHLCRWRGAVGRRQGTGPAGRGAGPPLPRGRAARGRRQGEGRWAAVARVSKRPARGGGVERTEGGCRDAEAGTCGGGHLRWRALAVAGGHRSRGAAQSGSPSRSARSTRALFPPLAHTPAGLLFVHLPLSLYSRRRCARMRWRRYAVGHCPLASPPAE